ncbi:uncharacterized protein LOC126368321 [Pectinophora gossypiella]|uniref:uncharacterized protein LOC126368321 n=1 Tax=Pectinophora gossypiella TaxID=13191 RepID=UPI00214F477E|nr:uncharacterized protein LOC126368321 [Pectinophora gossypiella]
MKKNKSNNNSVKKNTSKTVNVKASEKNKEVKIESLDEDNQGFGGWLRSDDGLENMKLFVIANSIVLLTTLVYPHLRTAIEILGEMVYGVQEDF